MQDTVVFGRYLSSHQRRPVRLYAAFVVSALLEAAVIGLFVLHSFLHVPELTPPPLWISFVREAPPPPPPAAPASRSPSTPAPRPRAKARPIVQPDQKIASRPDTPPPDDSDNNHGDDGPPGNDDGPGVPGGVPGSTGPVGPPQQPPPERPRLTVWVRLQQDQIGGELPHLPDAVKLRLRGSSITGAYQICIDRGGHVVQVLVRASIPGADELVSATLRTWTFKPQPLPVCAIKVFQFVVEG